MNHFSMNAVGSRLTSDLEHADWLVLNSVWDDYFKEENASRENGPDAPLQVVARDFILVREYDTFALYRRRSTR
jgi:hypothetical protein